MQYREFPDFRLLGLETANLLKEHFSVNLDTGHAVILPGGNTPLAVYEMLKSDPPRIDRELHVILSDERYVPMESPKSNYHRVKGLLDSVDIPESCRLTVDTNLDLNVAAATFDGKISSFFSSGGRITLALLGLGTDGHTASLFTERDLQDSGGKNAIVVNGPDGLERVSLAPAVIRAAGKIIFLAAGPDKSSVVEKFCNSPVDTVAGKAVAGGPEAEMWYSFKSPQVV